MVHRVSLLAQEILQCDFLELYPGERSLVFLSLAVFTTRAHFVVGWGQNKKLVAHADTCKIVGSAAIAEGQGHDRERERSGCGDLKSVDLGLTSLRFSIRLEHFARALLNNAYGGRAQVIDILERTERIYQTQKEIHAYCFTFLVLRIENRLDN